MTEFHPGDVVRWEAAHPVIRMRRHALWREGVAFFAPGCDIAPCGHGRSGQVTFYSLGGPGHGRCRCGALSPHLPSAYARKAWHREHKQQVAS